MMRDRRTGSPWWSSAGGAAVYTILALNLAVSHVSAQPKPIVGPQIRLDLGSGEAAANETTVVISQADSMTVIAAWQDWRTLPFHSTGIAMSTDDGITWDESLFPKPMECDIGPFGDPMSAVDPRTGTIWLGVIAFDLRSSCILVARKDPGQSEFQPPVLVRSAAYVDKGWMAAGPLPGAPESTRVYITYNEGIVWSDDMGGTWTSPKPLGAGDGFLPRVGPEGELYIVYHDQDERIRLKRSLNGGEAFSLHTVAHLMDPYGWANESHFPGRFRAPQLAYVDVHPTTGYLYAAYSDTTEIVSGQYNVDIYFTMSTDKGKTWSTPTIVNSDADPFGDQFFSWIEVDEDSRLHMVFLDSRHTPQDDDTLHGMLDVYYAYSVNEGMSWMEFRLTPKSWDSHYDGLELPDGRQFVGDYLGMDVADCLAFPTYLDTRANNPDIFTHVIELPLPGDVNTDGLIDVLDLLKVLEQWGTCEDAGGCVADLDGNGVIDVLDLLIVLGNWS